MDAARKVVDLSFRNALDRIEANVHELGALDAAAGDGDHGTTMVRGLRAANVAVAGLAKDTSAGKALAVAGAAFADAAGGASGALYGMFLMTTGDNLGDGPYDADAVAKAILAAAEGAGRMGKAQVGDKTFVDTLAPFADTLSERVEAGSSLPAAWKDALGAGEKGMKSTAGMVARKGRAARLGERSRAGLDPGAVSMLYLLQAAGSAIDQECSPKVTQ